MHVHKGKTEKLGKNCYGVIGTFTKGLLRIKNNNKEFYGLELTEYQVKRLSKEVIQSIENNEVIAATDASVKNEK